MARWLTHDGYREWHARAIVRVFTPSHEGHRGLVQPTGSSNQAEKRRPCEHVARVNRPCKCVWGSTKNSRRVGINPSEPIPEPSRVEQRSEAAPVSCGDLLRQCLARCCCGDGGMGAATMSPGESPARVSDGRATAMDRGLKGVSCTCVKPISESPPLLNVPWQRWLRHAEGLFGTSDDKGAGESGPASPSGCLQLQL